MSQKPVALNTSLMVWVNFFATREVIADLAAMKGADGPAWRQSISERVAYEMSRFKVRPGTEFDDKEAINLIIQNLFRETKQDGH